MSYDIFVKINTYEYAISKFIEWHNEEFESVGIPKCFSDKKIIRLMFFLASVDTSYSDIGLLDIFDNFYAMPLGSCEMDLVQNSSLMNRYCYSNNKLMVKNHIIKPILSIVLISKVDSQIKKLRSSNPKLVGMNLLDLCQINFRWHSWKSTYNWILRDKRTCRKISTELILSDIKYTTHKYNISFNQ